MYALADFKRNITGDVYGGLTAAIVALPLALAFGISSGVGPVAGLYGAIIIGFFASVFGGTPSQISGPTGPMTVVMAALVMQMQTAYPNEGLVLAFTTVFLGGCLQILFGVSRLGKYIVMVPYPVISGFMSGVGVIIILLELAPLGGLPQGGDVLSNLKHLPDYISLLHVKSLMVGSLALGIMFVWRGKLNRSLPAPLLAMIVGTIVVLLVDQDGSIPRIGDIPSSWPSLIIPTLHLDLLSLVLSNALMLAVLGSIDSLLTSLVADNITGQQHDSDKEMIGQGIGNALAGLLGGLPGAGATMRTLVNIRAGGTGPLSGVTHSIVLLFVVAGAGFLFKDIPQAALAGILVKVGVDIIDWPFLKRLHRLPKFPVFLMLLVLLLTVFVDLITAVFVGVFIKNIVVLNQLSNFELGSIVFADRHKNIDRLPKKERDLLKVQAQETALIRITGPISYAVCRGIKQYFEQFKSNKTIIVDLTGASFLGISTAVALEDLIRSALARGSEIKLIGLDCSNSRELVQLGFRELVGEENCAASVMSVLQKNTTSEAEGDRPA